MFEGRNIIAAAGVAVAAAVGISSMAQRNDAGEIMSAGSVDAFEVQVGDCFQDGAFASEDVSEVPGVPCSEPHDNEVYAAYDVQGEWPGDERIEEMAYRGCYERFEGAIGKRYEESIIDYTVIYPSEGSWHELDDREVICVAYHMEFEQLTGTIIGSGL
jgi:hypothetical protein